MLICCSYKTKAVAGIDHGVGHPIWGCSRRISSSKKIPYEIRRLTSYLKDTWDDLCVNFPSRSCWIPGSYAAIWPKALNSTLRPLRNKGFEEERMTKIGWRAFVKGAFDVSYTRRLHASLREKIPQKNSHSPLYKRL